MNSAYKTRTIFFSLLIFVLLFTHLHLPGHAEKSPFLIDDSLLIKSFSPQDITKDGRYIAGVISIRKDRLGTDHKRYRDPTYISPRPVEVVILDTKNQKMHSLFKEKVEVQSLAWSPDGKTLAFFLRKGDRYFLHTYEWSNKKTKEIKLKTKKQISSDSFLIWTNDGTSLIFSLRADGWEEKARQIFKEATMGPVIVYDSREPFLKWDVIRDHSQLQVPAIVTLQTQAVKELLPESRYSNVRLARDDSFLTYVETFPIKTEYGQNYYRQGGREYELFRLNLREPLVPNTLIKRGKKHLNFSWNEENTLFAWVDEGDIFVQSVDEAESRNLTKDKVKPEEEPQKKDETKTSTDAEKKEEEKKKVRFSLVRFSPDGAKILASTNKGYWLIDHKSEDLTMVYEFPEEKEDQETGRGASPSQRVVGWSPDGRYLYMTYAAKDRWERGFTRYDLNERHMQDLVKDSNLYRSLRMSKDGQKFFYSFSDGDLPSDLYMTDKDFSRMTRLTELNPWIMEKKLTKSELIPYLDVDGEELFGILYYPVDYEPGKKYPLVCEIYERFFDNGFNVVRVKAFGQPRNRVSRRILGERCNFSDQ